MVALEFPTPVRSLPDIPPISFSQRELERAPGMEEALAFVWKRDQLLVLFYESGEATLKK